MAGVCGLAKLHMPRKGLPLNARGAIRAQTRKMAPGRKERSGNSDTPGG